MDIDFGKRATSRATGGPEHRRGGAVIHKLKIWPQYFQAKLAGLKPWEYRVNDRDFKVGDELLLLEWCPVKNEYTGNHMITKIIYLHDCGDGKVILSDTMVGGGE